MFLLIEPFAPQSVSAELSGNISGSGSFTGNIESIPVSLVGDLSGGGVFNGDLVIASTVSLGGDIAGSGTFRGNFSELFVPRVVPGRARNDSSGVRGTPASVEAPDEPGRS